MLVAQAGDIRQRTGEIYQRCPYPLDPKSLFQHYNGNPSDMAKVPFQIRGLDGTDPDLARWLPLSRSAFWMGKAQQYRYYDAECIRLAQHCTVPIEKETLLGMAEAWRRLAEREESTPGFNSGTESD